MVTVEDAVHKTGAGDGNRTHVSSLGSCSSTIELHPPHAKVYEVRSATATSDPYALMELPRMSQAHHSHHHHPHHAAHFLADSVHVLGLPISMYSHGLVQVLAAHSDLKTVHVRSVERKVDDQARAS